ncbi:unnamed protein product [Nippostrongylus brasiliensis]|uniref:RING-type domain-containing protein n=1 Tax=Nippostrongylus brasiliensis TaxID=27835 RepID=A0A158QZR0_NIPBR|nr:unnamed protein product [Nippostrongylus brasiliensis]
MDVNVLNKDIENLTSDSDQLLGEIIRCRKLYPEAIAKMKSVENREKFVRLLKAPLKLSQQERIDVEKLKEDITRKVDTTQDLTETIKVVKADIERLEAEKLEWRKRVQDLVDTITGDRLAPIDALPSNFTLTASKEDLEWLDYQLALRLQEEVNAPPTVEDTLNEEQLKEILGRDYYANDADNSEGDDDESSSPSTSREAPYQLRSRARLERNTGAHRDETPDTDFSVQFLDDDDEDEVDEGEEEEADQSFIDDGDVENEESEQVEDEQEIDGADEIEDATHEFEDASDTSDDEESDPESERENASERAHDEELSEVNVSISDSIISDVPPLPPDPEFDRRVRGELLVLDESEDEEFEVTPADEEERPNHEFDEDIIDDTVIRSDLFGRCTICFEELPYDPVGCLYCQQHVGCRRCVVRWYRAAEHYNRNDQDLLGGHPPSNHKQCPLCRHQWEEQAEVTSMFLLRDDYA